jgi:Protein of unknown function (DUF3237)
MMRAPFPLGEPASLLERAGLPLPRGMVPAGMAPVLAVAAAPAHPANIVQVQMRRAGGLAQLVRAVPEATPWREGAQWFRAALPALDPGHRVDYRMELLRAGQRLVTLPADGSWLTLTGDAASTPRSGEPAPGPPAGVPPPARVPRWGYEMTFLATLTASLRPEILGSTPEGYRVDFYIQGGRVIGPRVDAVLRPRGGDWMRIRPDGIGIVDIRATWETREGVLILDEAGGVFDLGRDGYAKAAAGRFSGTAPLYVTPRWSTGHPDWQWLTRCQGFGIGQVIMDALEVQCDIYIPRVLSRPHDG